MNPPQSEEIDSSLALLSVLYVSSATALFTDEQLVSFLRAWRDNNRKNEITGFLLYEGGNFMQVIEGPPASIEGLVDEIAVDPRHKGMRILWKHSIGEREFGNWYMGFRKISELSAEDQRNFSSLLENAAMDPEFHNRKGSAHEMLLEFKNVCLRRFSENAE